VELVTDLYKSGLTDFQNVLDTQQSLFQQQDELASTSGDVLQSLIDLYKATGGGWTPLDIEEKEQDNGYCETDPVPEAGQ
jgi:outer membrane protein TolC